MIYFFCAMHVEASVWIQEYGLHRKKEMTRWQVYGDEKGQALLMVTGIGSMEAAIALSSLCTQYPPKEQDILVNIGTCQAKTGQGRFFLCNKITETGSGRDYYPDVLYRHPFLETAIETGNHVSRTEKKIPYDMESAGIFQAGSHFFKMHHMIFLKMPTDNGDIEKVTAEKITGAMGDEREKVCCFLKQVQMAGNEEAQSKVVFSKEETQALDSFAEKLHCTVSMQHRLRQAAQYRKLTGENLLDGIQKIEEKNPGPYKGKREGNTVLEQFVRV